MSYYINNVYVSFRLEFLSQYEVEVASRIGLAAEDFVETVGPVDTKQADHGKEDAGTDTDGTLHVERIEVLDVAPRITSLSEYQTIEVGAGTQDEGITQLDRETVVSVTGFSSGSERTVVVTAHSDGLGGVCRTVTAGSVTTHIVGLEG